MTDYQPVFEKVLRDEITLIFGSEVDGDMVKWCIDYLRLNHPWDQNVTPLGAARQAIIAYRARPART